MNIFDIENILKETTINGFPIVISKESQYLFGYILRRDIKMAIGKRSKKFQIAL